MDHAHEERRRGSLMTNPHHNQPMNLRSVYLGACLLLSLGAAGAQSLSNVALPPTVLEALKKAEMPTDALAVVALPLGPGRARAWGHQARRPMQPASTMKLITSIVALDRLGPNQRGFTEFRSAAALVDGTLQGDLVLRGGADPELGVPQLWALLLELRHQGIQTIAGDLVIDRNLWRPARMDLGLPPFDDAPEFPYNVIPDALQLAGNLLPIAFSSDALGVSATTVPPLDGLSFRSQMTLNERGCADWDDDWLPAAVQRDGKGTVIELRGAFPKNCKQRAELQLLDRTELAERLLRTLWQQLGGRWDGRAVESATTTSTTTSATAVASTPTRLLARRQSRPWGEVLRFMNKTSDNAVTRMLYLNLGVAGMAADPLSSTAALADKAVQQWFVEQGIDAQGLVMDNGSGLSRSARISALQMALALKVAHQSRYAADLTMSLPTAGVDGTMRLRLANSPANGWARLKTGTLRNAVALAGYMKDADGQPWVVAMILNHEPAGRGRPVLDALVDHIARLGVPGNLSLKARAQRTGPQGEGP